MCGQPVIHKRFSLLIGLNFVVCYNAISDGLTNGLSKMAKSPISKPLDLKHTFTDSIKETLLKEQKCNAHAIM